MTLARWKDITEWPIVIAAISYLVVYSWLVLHPNLSGTPLAIGEGLQHGIWAVFAIHYIVSFILAPAKFSWTIRHLPELIVVMLPMFRSLQLLRLVAAMSMLHRILGTALRGKVLFYAVGGAALLIYVAALAMYDIESTNPDSPINSFWDSLWWAIVTITTVGYGDLYPVTLTGRLIAVALMIYGIALLGVITATLASWLIRQVAEEEEKAQAATKAHIDDLSDKIEDLQQLVISLGGEKLVKAQGVPQEGIEASLSAERSGSSV